MENREQDSARNGQAPDPEVAAVPRRRSFTAEYKAGILEQVRAGKEPIGVILRRAGLYSSHLTSWRTEADRGSLAALSKKRGRHSKKDPLADEVEQLRRENAKLKQRLAQAEVIIDIQKKVASILGIPLKTPGNDGADS
jgi:transposase